MLLVLSWGTFMSVMNTTSIGGCAIPVEGGSPELLAVLMSNFIPSDRAVDVIHGMRERFGSIAKAMRRQPEDLRRVPGLCDTAAFVIDLLHQIQKETLREDLWREEVTFRSGVAVRYCREAFRSDDRDVSKVFYLRAGRVVKEGPVSIGAVGSGLVYTREVMKTALFCQATGALIVFGRSYGGPELNEREADIVERLRNSAETFDIGVEADLVLTHT